MRISAPIVALPLFFLACETSQAQYYYDYYPGAFCPPAVSWVPQVPYYRVYTGYSSYLREQTELLRLENEKLRLARAMELDRMRAQYQSLSLRQELRRQELAYDRWKSEVVELANLYRLNDLQFNPVTGRIRWPFLAESPRYTEHRQLIEGIVRRIVHYGLWNDGLHVDELARACRDFRDQLRKDAAEESGKAIEAEFVAVQRFLLGIKYSPYLMSYEAGSLDRLATRLESVTEQDEDLFF